MDNVWLLGAAIAFFVLALVTLVALAAKRRSRKPGGGRAGTASAASSREEELRALGISEVRPKQPSRPTATSTDTFAPKAAAGSADTDGAVKTGSEEPQPLARRNQSAKPEAPAEAEEVVGGAAVAPESGPLPEREPDAAREEGRMLQAADDHPFWQTHSPTAFASFLRALWAATEVQTALLVTTEADGTYALLASRSHLRGVRQDGRFPADSFLHVAQPERPITVLAADDPLLRDLPYYRSQTNVSEVAVLPVSDPDGLPLYLVVDLQPDQPNFTDRQRALLLGFADLLGTMVAHPQEEPSARGVPTRRAIISDEMSRARREERPLSLALVYRVDAEMLAGKGKGAVAEAERSLRLLLEDLVHHGRLERFGELMYGAFLYDEPHAVEEWAQRVHARAEGEGFDVAVGVARLGRHRDADALRADAANALQEALHSDERFTVAEPLAD